MKCSGRYALKKYIAVREVRKQEVKRKAIDKNEWNTAQLIRLIQLHADVRTDTTPEKIHAEVCAHAEN